MAWPSKTGATEAILEKLSDDTQRGQVAPDAWYVFEWRMNGQWVCVETNDAFPNLPAVRRAVIAYRNNLGWAYLRGPHGWQWVRLDAN